MSGDAATKALGTEVDTVWVEIDYSILQHFSKHLYSSPNKAVEELVTNGYDALAERVDVYLPGSHARDCLLVWDDGGSMDVQGLKHLWWIARSPKDPDGRSERVAVSEDGRTSRRMIGKFGIGKLASYAVGNRLTHLCRRGVRYLLVSVDYGQAPPLTDDPNRERGFHTPVLELDEKTAQTYVRSLLREVPADLDTLLARQHWTLAIVDDLKDDVRLTQGRLRWVLGNGMPLRPDFEVWVNAERVQPTIAKDPVVDWNLSTSEVAGGLVAQWKAAVRHEEATGVPAFGTGLQHGEAVDGGGPDSDPGLQAAKEAWADVPGLGRVRARLRLFNNSLKEGRAADHGRSEGFFVYVRGRLLNPDDAKLLLPDPSFGAFNRMQVIIWADGLDAELLADRERLQRASPITNALAIVQQALYLVGRARLERHDDEDASQAPSLTVLPAESRDFFRQPLVALALRQQADGQPALDPARATLGSEAGAESDALMRIDAARNQLVLNTAHPLYTAVRSKVGNDRRGRDSIRLVELVALSDVLLEGHLLDVGVDEKLVDRVMAWRAAQIRSLAVRYEAQPDQVVSEAYDASYPGGARFEHAIAQLFRLMGFVAERDGEKGKKDVLVVAPVGEEEYRFTVETKGNKGGKSGKEKTANDTAEISGASNHAKQVGARFALVVAREFAGFDRPGEEPAVLGECRTQNPPVSIATVETLHALYDALAANHYPLPILVPVLEEIQSPAEKLAAVRALQRPVEQFDVRDLLDRTWALQQGTASGELVAARQLQQSRPDWKTMSKTFERVLFGMDALSGGLFVYRDEEKAVTLLQSPEVVAEAIAEAFAARDHRMADVAGDHQD
jgi:hypothetical protein